jgi:hypothetical protein
MNEESVFQLSLPWLLGYGMVIFLLFAGFVAAQSPADALKQPGPD